MQYVTDLHLHSKYSRAVSPEMVLPTMSRYAKQKGLDILTASDWTHPLWMKEVSNLLEEAGEGIYKLKYQMSNVKYPMSNEERGTLFIFTTEISCIYKQNGKLRRIHNLVFAPSIEVAEKISSALLKRGANLSSDGRPIIGMSSKELLQLVLEVDEKAMLIPCHVWTPHFGMYGSASGFDSIEESFEELSQYIYGIETGLSSDPEMNWEIPELKSRSILSFSDAHSPAKMGREATIMELEKPDFPSIRSAITRFSVLSSQLSDKGQSVVGQSVSETDKQKTGKPKSENRKQKTENRVVYTIEFYPEEGKYHFTGHRDCKVSRDPEEVAKLGVVCPVCKRKMTEGVLFRVQQLAGEGFEPKAQVKMNEHGLKWYTDKKRVHPPFVKLVPLLEVIAESMGSTVASQKVKEQYASVVSSLGNEIEVLLKIPIDDIMTRFGVKLADGIAKVRKGDIFIIPGFDNQYGVVKIWQDDEPPPSDTEQMSLL